MKTKVVIGIPSGDMVHADFAFSLAQLIGYVAINNKDVGLRIVNPRKALVEVSRNEIVKQALEAKADYVLFLDSDMTFPPGVLDELLGARRDVVWVNYSRRRAPYVKVCEDDKLATGCLLVKTAVFKTIPAPWFKVEWDGAKYTGEDFYFGELLKMHGVTPYMHGFLSRKIGHIGATTHYL